MRIPSLEKIAARYRPRREWSTEEEEAMRAYYGRVPARDLAAALSEQFGRKITVPAVYNKAQSMGLMATTKEVQI